MAELTLPFHTKQEIIEQASQILKMAGRDKKIAIKITERYIEKDSTWKTNTTDGGVLISTNLHYAMLAEYWKLVKAELISRL